MPELVRFPDTESEDPPCRSMLPVLATEPALTVLPYPRLSSPVAFTVKAPVMVSVSGEPEASSRYALPPLAPPRFSRLMVGLIFNVTTSVPPESMVTL